MIEWPGQHLLTEQEIPLQFSQNANGYSQNIKIITSSRNHKIYNRVVKILCKAKRIKDNAVVEAIIFCNGFFYKGMIFITKHSLFYFNSSTKQQAEIIQISFQGYKFKGKCYLLDESSKRWKNIYEKQHKEYMSVKKQQQLQRSPQRNKNLIKELVSQDLICLQVKEIEYLGNQTQRNKTREVLREEISFADKIEGPLQIIYWEPFEKEYDEFSEVKYEQILINVNVSNKVFIRNDNEVIEYIRGLKAGNSGALIFQNSKVIGMHCLSIFSMNVGIGKRFGTNFAQVAYNYHLKFVKNKSNKQNSFSTAQSQMYRLKYWNFTAGNRQFIVHIIVSFRNSQTPYSKFSTGVLLDQRNVLTNLFNILSTQISESSNLRISQIQIKCRIGQEEIELTVPDNLKQHADNCLANCIKLYKEYEKCSTNRQIFGEDKFKIMLASSLLILQLKNPIQNASSLSLFQHTGINDLTLTSYGHKISKQERTLNVSHFNIKKQKEIITKRPQTSRLTIQRALIISQITKFNNNQMQISPFKAGQMQISPFKAGAPINQQIDGQLKVVGMHWLNIQGKQLAVFFNQQFAKVINQSSPLVQIQHLNNNQNQAAAQAGARVMSLKISHRNPKIFYKEEDQSQSEMRLYNNCFVKRLKKFENGQKHIFYSTSLDGKYGKKIQLKVQIKPSALQDVKHISHCSFHIGTNQWIPQSAESSLIYSKNSQNNLQKFRNKLNNIQARRYLRQNQNQLFEAHFIFNQPKRELNSIVYESLPYNSGGNKSEFNQSQLSDYEQIRNSRPKGNVLWFTIEVKQQVEVNICLERQIK